MLKKIQLVISVSMMFAAAVISAEPMQLDVDTAVKLALENNLNLKSSAIDVDLAERPYNNIWNNFLPTIGSTTVLGKKDLLLTDPMFNPLASQNKLTLTESISASLTLNAALFTGIEITRMNYQSGLLSYEMARKELETNVRKAFFGLIATRTSRDLIQSNIQTAEKQYSQALENYNNGLIPELDLLRVRVRVENLKPGLNQVANSYENSLMTLKFLLGLDRNVELSLNGELEVQPREFDAETLIGRYTDSRLDVRSLSQALEIQKRALTANRQRALTPSVTLSAGWSIPAVTDPFNGDSWSKDTLWDQGSASLTIAMPLDGFIPGSGTQDSFRKAEDQIRQTELKLALVRENAGIEITNLVMNLASGSQSIETYKLNMELARRAYDMTAEAYRLGTKEYLEVESAQNELFKAQQDVLLEQYKYLSGLLDLEYALNTPIEEIITE